MDAALEKSCMEEISHTVLDSLGKISVRSISNNYGLNFMEAVKVLQQWIDKNSTQAKLTKEFVVRGIDSKLGSPFITMANEKKLKTIESKANKVSNVIYSVEVSAESSRKLNIPENQEFRMINLSLKTDKRNVKVFTPADPPPAAVKQESKPKVNSMFAASTSKPVSKPETPKPSIKEEKQSPSTVKQEPVKRGSPHKSPTKSSPNKKKDTKKPVTGKASIASFFSNKPATSKPATITAAAVSASKDIKVEKESPKDAPQEEKQVNGKEEESQRWKRMISDESDDEVVPNTPQERKETKKGSKKPRTLKKSVANKANPSKKSRILQIEDSSEDEEEEDKNLREPEERLVKFDTEESNDVEMKEDDEEGKKQLSPEKPVENDSNSLNRKKSKVKKLVTKTFMDEEGYLTTVKEYEMVSASEDETDASNNNSTGKKETKKESASAGGKGKTDKAADKKASKVTPPTPKTKQGSIMSFFSKK